MKSVLHIKLKSVIKLLFVAFLLFGSLGVFSQPFTITADQGVASVVSSPATTCGSNYTFYITTNANWWKIFYLYDNGVAVTNSTWTISGETFKYVGWSAGMWGREGGGDNSTFYCLVNPTTKTITVTTTAPVCGTPAVALATNAVSAANIAQGSINNVVRGFTLTTTTADATLNTVTFSNTGNAVYTTDITNYKLYYTSTSSTFATGTLLGTITSGTSFTGLTQSIPVGGPYYFWITADIVSTATSGRTITVGAMATTDFTLASGTKSGSAAASGTQTIVAPAVTVAAGSAVAAGNIGQNTTNNIVSTITMSVTNAAATVNSIAFTNTGNADYTSDITNYKLYYTSTSSTFATGTLLGTITSGTTFSTLTQSMAVGGPYYYWITADMKPAATVGRTITVSSISNTNITFASGTKSGSNSAGGTKTVIATTPAVTLADNTVVPLGTVTKPSTNNIIARFTLAASAANSATLNTLNFTTTGTAVHSTDITNFKLWYASSNAFGSASQIGSSITTTLGAGAHSFTGLTQSITFSTTGYFWITADIPAGATTNNTLAVSALGTTNFTLASGSKSGSTTASGTQTISSVITLYSIAGGGNWNDTGKWSTTAGGASCTCYPQAGVNNAVITSGNPITVNTASGSVDVTINSGATLTGSSNALTISGNFVNSGTYSATSNITSIAGNFTSTGTFTHNNGTVSMNGTTAQSISVAGNMNSLTNANTTATVTAGSSLTVNQTLTTSAGATLDMSTYQLLGTLNTITNSGTIKTSCTSNPPIPTGKTWGGTVQYANTTGYVSNGTYNNLSMLNASGAPVALNNLTVNGTLTTTASGILDLAGYNIGGTLGTITNNGTIKSTNNNPFPTGKTWGGTIEYAATAGNQTIASGTYNNLTNSNTSATNTANGNIVVNGTLITTAGGTFSLSTNTLSGTLGTITNNGTISTANTSATPFPSGKTWGGTVKNLNANITLVAGTYNNFTVDNGNVTVSGAVNIGGILSWANNGVITTSAGNTVTITNTAVGAVPVGTTSRYISGPLTRTIAANLTSSANVYEFPVGKGGTYYPYSMTTLTTGAVAPTITVEAFNANCGGSSDGTTAGSLSTTEYWSASFTGNYTTGSVSIGRQTAALAAIGRSATAAGVYTSIGGTVSGNNINTSSLTGASLGYFAMCKVPYYSRTSGSWTTAATWSTSCGGAASSSYPGAGDIVTICGGNTVTLNDNVTVGTLTVTGSGSNLTMGDMWNETLTVTGNTYIDEGGTMTGASSNKWFYWVFNNLLIGSNSTTAATSSFDFTYTNTNGCGLTVSGALTVGSCDETSLALFNYSPILSGGTNTITIPNRTMYPNGTYTFAPTGGSAPAAPSTTVTTLACPRITASSTSLNGMSYVVSAGPSVVRSFTVTGTDLVGSGNITVSAASTDYEVCSTSGGTYSSSFTIPFASGVITGQPISVYVRLKAGLAKGSYNSQIITLTGGTATRNITCNGMVTAVISAAKSTLTPTSNTIVADGATIQILTVQAYDTDGTAVSTPGLTVAITRQSGTGTIGAVTDNGNGTYTAVVTSPTTVGSGVFVATIGGSQVQGNTGSQTQSTITYIAGPPTTLTVQAGNNQSATVSTSVPIDPSVVLTDANGNPVSGIDVTFTVTSGGGVVTNYVVVTNASGIATLGDWQLGATPGTNTISAVASSSVPIKAISYPFPQSLRQTYPYGITASAPDYGRIQTLVDQWKTSFYTEGTCGSTPCARVKWDIASNTVSEGIAYGMLIFVYTENETNNYKDEFDKLWQYYDYHKDGKGLMDWKIDAFTGTRLGTGGATDADMDVALALIQAHRQWGSSGAINYIAEAEELLNNIYDNEVDATTHTFKPGGNWNSVQNPSYAELFAIKLASDVQASEGFAVTNDWATVYTAMQNYTTHYQDATTGLWPNWTDPNATGACNSAGYNAADDKCGGWYNQGCVYGVDALRTPWRVAWDYAWYGTASSKASTDLLAGWLGTGSIADNPANVGGLYNLDGTRYTACTRADTTNLLGFYGGMAHAYMSNDAEQANLDTWYNYVEDANIWHGEYYNPSLQILYLLTLSGNTPNFTSMDPLVAPPVAFSADAEAFLPIELISFSVLPKKEENLLSWTTASELNNDYFILERSYDGNNWEAIYTCKGAGTSSINHSYSYMDNDISEHPSPYIYYKLKQVDFNGENSTSKIISIFNSINTTSNIYVYPNPFDGRVLYLTGLKDNVEIELYNSAGAVIYRNKIFASTTVVIINLDNELPSGVYSIKCRTPNKTYLQQLLVK